MKTLKEPTKADIEKFIKKQKDKLYKGRLNEDEKKELRQVILIMEERKREELNSNI